MIICLQRIGHLFTKRKWLHNGTQHTQFSKWYSFVHMKLEIMYILNVIMRMKNKTKIRKFDISHDLKIIKLVSFEVIFE